MGGRWRGRWEEGGRGARWSGGNMRDKERDTKEEKVGWVWEGLGERDVVVVLDGDLF